MGLLNFFARWIHLQGAVAAVERSGNVVIEGTTGLISPPGANQYGGGQSYYATHTRITQTFMDPGYTEELLGQVEDQANALLEQLQVVEAKDMELYLPQLSRLLVLPSFGLQSANGPSQALANGLASVVLQRCAENPAVGVKMCWLLQDILDDVTVAGRGRSPAMLATRNLLYQTYQITMQGATEGPSALPPYVANSRHRYFRDCMAFMQSLVKISVDLVRIKPREQRPAQLWRMLESLNRRLLCRMATCGEFMGPSEMGAPPEYMQMVDERAVAAGCPGLAKFAVHLSCAPSNTKALRVLRIVKEECSVMHSRSRAPYLIVLELLEDEEACDSTGLYCPKSATAAGQGQLKPGAETETQSTAEIPQVIGNEDSDKTGPAAGTGAGTASGTGTGSGALERVGRVEKVRRIGVESWCINSEEDYHDVPATADTGGSGDSDVIPDPMVAAARLRRDEARDQVLRPQELAGTETNRLGKSTSGNEGSTEEGQRPSREPTVGELIAFPPREGDHPRDQWAQRAVFGEFWAEKRHRVRKNSYFGHLPGWTMASFIVKAGDNLRQEQLAMQVMRLMQSIFKEEGLGDRLHLRPYNIITTGPKAGLIETVVDSRSIDHVKKTAPSYVSLRDFYERIYGPPGFDGGQGGSPYGPPPSLGQPMGYGANSMPFMNGMMGAQMGGQIGPQGYGGGMGQQLMGPQMTSWSGAPPGVPSSMASGGPMAGGSPGVPPGGMCLFRRAQENFAASLAAYSLFTYLLQVKDRHNANILMDRDGNMLHIDFGYILGQSPGGNMGFETAPFKLTKEYIDLLDGKGSAVWRDFEARFRDGFVALRKHEKEISALFEVEFQDPMKRRKITDSIRARLYFAQSEEDILQLIEDSADKPRTKQYDWYQWKTNGILE